MFEFKTLFLGICPYAGIIVIDEYKALGMETARLCNDGMFNFPFQQKIPDMKLLMYSVPSFMKFAIDTSFGGFIKTYNFIKNVQNSGLDFSRLDEKLSIIRAIRCFIGYSYHLYDKTVLYIKLGRIDIYNIKTDVMSIPILYSKRDSDDTCYTMYVYMNKQQSIMFNGTMYPIRKKNLLMFILYMKPFQQIRICLFLMDRLTFFSRNRYINRHDQISHDLSHKNQSFFPLFVNSNIQQLQSNKPVLFEYVTNDSNLVITMFTIYCDSYGTEVNVVLRNEFMIFGNIT